MDPVLRPRYRTIVSRPALDPWAVCHSLLAWLIALNAADLITTHGVLRAGGRETNPIMQPVIHNFWAAGAVKAACLALVVALAFRIRRPERVALALGAVNLWYACVVGWNFAMLARAGA